ncbi:MAG TPA: class A beta-lactamase [Vicinamibacterales bacterium]|nr:class A beta-lactamase [Vicinamibacterales bacterium]
MHLQIALLLLFATTSPATAQVLDLSPLETTFNRIANSARAKIGVALIHLESGRLIVIRGDERFPMASVVKLPIAIEVLAQISEGKLSLDRQVWIGPSDIRPCCTLSRRHPNGAISRTVGELLELALIESDNTAADSLLALVGGPPRVEWRLRALGFTTINVNRSEGQLLLDMAGVVGAPPPEQWTLELQRRLVDEVSKDALKIGRERFLQDERDTATPYDMALLLGRLQLGNLLPAAQTNALLNLMSRSKTGPRRIKGRLPADTHVAHKTGTTTVVINDVGVITLPPDSAIGGHLVLSVFVTNDSHVTRMERAIAQLSAAAFEYFTGKTISPR